MVSGDRVKNDFLDVVQFATGTYFTEEDEQVMTIDVVRIGPHETPCKVRYKSEDGRLRRPSPWWRSSSAPPLHSLRVRPPPAQHADAGSSPRPPAALTPTSSCRPGTTRCSAAGATSCITPWRASERTTHPCATSP